MIILQKSKRSQQIDDEINDIQHKKKKKKKNNSNELIIKMHGFHIQTYQMGCLIMSIMMVIYIILWDPTNKYKKDWWYSFQIDCAIYSYKYPLFATNYKKNWKLQEEGYFICQEKRDAELFKKYGTKVIRTAE